MLLVRANASGLYRQLGMPERLALLRRMDAAGLVPQELAADLNGHRAAASAPAALCVDAGERASTAPQGRDARSVSNARVDLQ